MAHRHRCCQVLVASLLCLADAVPLRALLLKEAHERLESFYTDSSKLDDPKQKSGVTVRLSKEDKECGGDGVPLTFVEYDVEGVRPVDVFNVLAEPHSQPSWDDHCAKMDPLGDFERLQAKAFAGLFVAPGAPVSGREGYEWMVAEANFTTEEFWVVFSTYENDDLKQRRPFDSGSVEMQNCLGAYKITKTAKGAHILNTQQLNSHSWPLSARYVAEKGWTGSVDFAESLRKVAPTQKQKGWNDTQTSLPSWMLEDRPCGPTPPDWEMRQSILAHATAELALPESERGARSTHALDSGATLTLWQREETCGGGGVPSASIPVWWSEFTIPKALPEEVFNWLVAKDRESIWHEGQGEVNYTGFHGGARGIHEEFLSPKVLFMQFEPRELWEWQVASHSIENNSYLLAIQSATKPNTDSFTDDSVTGFQCLAAYEVLPAPSGSGTLVRMSSHLNPNVGLLSRLSFLWKQAGYRIVQEFASALTAATMPGPPQTLDGGALALLAPPPPDSNASLTLDHVVHTSAGNDSSIEFLRGFATLNLPSVLAVSADKLDATSKLVLALFNRVKSNATDVERAAFSGGAAASQLQLQRQGEALSAMQLRAIQVVARYDCEGTGDPDWDKNKPSSGIPFGWLVTIGVVILVAMITICGWCCCRYTKYRRSKRAAQAAAALLSHRDSLAAAEAGTSMAGPTE